MKIDLILKHIWGKERLYPNSPDAHVISKITEKPTFSKKQVHAMKDAGWSVCITTTPVNLDEFLKVS